MAKISKAKFMAVDAACKAIFCPTTGPTEGMFDGSGFHADHVESERKLKVE